MNIWKYFQSFIQSTIHPTRWKIFFIKEFEQTVVNYTKENISRSVIRGNISGASTIER